jgi:hypothetical protein
VGDAIANTLPRVLDAVLRRIYATPKEIVTRVKEAVN